MSSMEEVAATEEKMNAAKDALMSYIESREPIDGGQHGRLLARVKKTEADFLRAVSELGK